MFHHVPHRMNWVWHLAHGSQGGSSGRDCSRPQQRQGQMSYSEKVQGHKIATIMNSTMLCNKSEWTEGRPELNLNDLDKVLKTVKTWFKRCFCVCNLAFNNRNKVSEDCIQRECWDGEKIHSIQWYVLDLSFWKCCRTKVYCSRKMSVSFLILKSHRLWCKHITSNSAYIMRLWQFSLCGAISTHFGYTWGNVSMSVVS